MEGQGSWIRSCSQSAAIVGDTEKERRQMKAEQRAAVNLLIAYGFSHCMLLNCHIFISADSCGCCKFARVQEGILSNEVLLIPKL